MTRRNPLTKKSGSEVGLVPLDVGHGHLKKDLNPVGAVSHQPLVVYGIGAYPWSTPLAT